MHTLRHRLIALIAPTDRSSLPKDPDPFNSEVHTHLAHGVVGYLGLNAPDQLEPYGIRSAGDLVDLISRVSDPFPGLFDRGLL